MSYETKLLLPRLGEGDGGGRVVGWLKQPGDTFEKDETLLEVETDKAVIEVPAPQGGKLVETIADVDDLVDFQDPIARVEYEGEAPEPEPEPEPENTPSEEPAEPTGPARIETTSPVDIPAAPQVTVSGEDTTGRRFATPWARRLARQHDVDLSTVRGSGKKGRIVGDDVLRAAQGAGVALKQDRGATPVVRNGKFEVTERMIDVGEGALLARTWTPGNPRGGSGVVLVHGLFADVEAWSANATVLARRGITVTAIDLPCHGRSTSESSEFDVVVDRVVAALEQLGNAPFVLVGHSFGAAVAARAATRLVRTPTALALISPAGMGTGIDQSFVDGMVNAYGVEALQREMRKLTARPMSVGREFVEALHASLSSRRDRLASLCESLSVGGVQQVDIVPDLDAVEPPVRIVHGRQDGIIPYHHALNAPPRVALHLPPEAGHMPQWETSAVVNEVVASLCEL